MDKTEADITANTARAANTVSAPQAGPDQYCEEMLAREDEDFSLTLRYGTARHQPAMAAIFALALELRRIPSVVKEPPIGEIRLQWWRDALAAVSADHGPKGHPVLQALQRAGSGQARLVDETFLRIVDDGIDARSRVLYPDPFDDAAALGAYYAASEGWLPRLLAAVTGETPNAHSPWDPIFVDLSAAYGLARWGRGQAPYLPADTIIDEARRRRRAAFAAAHSMPSPNPSASVLASVLYLTLAPGYAKRAADAAWPLAKQLALFRAMVLGRF